MTKSLKFVLGLKYSLFLIFILILGVTVRALVLEYRENKIIRTTFDNSGHYKSYSPKYSARVSKHSIILFGDSRIKQWKPLPIIEGSDILNRGISGETTAQMVLRFKQDVLDLNPSAVVIQAGVNDLVAASMVGPELKIHIYKQCVNNLRKMVDLAIEQKIVVILLEIVEPYDLGFIRSILWGNDLTHLVHNVNKELLTFSNISGLYILDTNKTLQKKKHQWKPGVNKDALHFTTKAYHFLNNKIVRLFAKISLL